MLRHVPILYGVWHPYKHMLWVVHRTYFPIIAQLESLGEPQPGQRVVAHRRVANMERLFGGLLIAGYSVRDGLVVRLRSREAAVQATADAVSADPSNAQARQKYQVCVYSWRCCVTIASTCPV